MSDATLRWQAQRIEELEAIIADMKEKSQRTAPKPNQPLLRLRLRYGLSVQHARIIYALWRGRGTIVEHATIIGAMYRDESEMPGDPMNVMQLQVCRLRKVFPIKLHHSLGYSLDMEAVRAISDLLKQPQQWRAA